MFPYIRFESSGLDTVWYGMCPQQFVVCEFRENNALKGTLY